MLFKKPELLAPAGNLECFHAAIDAGADAVYVGLGDFNARLRAKNFTVKTLSFLVPYAHGKKRKVYITLNTLIKQAELETLVHLLYQLDQIRVDGLIVQDLGLVDICRTTFPRLKLHASTQMSIHNSLGIAAARELGVCRVILARELTLKEITAIRRGSPIELEVFVHGALCYSVSGMCLASSFLGGSSGNRGRCTQVCRRPFSSRASKGNFFSPADLCALSYIKRYREIGIDSLKIEGRMKSAEYVAFVVSTYRKAIDDPGSISGLLERIRLDLGRNKTTLFLEGINQRGIIDQKGPTGSGLYIGTIEKCKGSEVIVAGTNAVSEGDAVRVQPRSGFEGRSVRVAKVSINGGRSVLVLKEDPHCGVGDAVYLTRRAAVPGKEAARRAITVKPAPFRQTYFGVRALLKRYCVSPTIQKSVAAPRFFVKIDDPGWLALMDPAVTDALIVAFEIDEMENVLLKRRVEAAWLNKIIINFPPFIGEGELADWKRIASGLRHAGMHRVMVSNLGQRQLIDARATIYGDAMPWCFNRAAQEALGKLGVTRFSYSPEDDYPNIKNARSLRASAYVFMRVPLFISRIKPAIVPGEQLTDALGNHYGTARKHGLYYCIAREPLCLFHKRGKLEELGTATFVIDLSFCKPDKQFLNDLLMYYQQRIKVPGSSLFNFKEGIR